LVALILIVLGGWWMLGWLDGGSAGSANPLTVIAVYPENYREAVDAGGDLASGFVWDVRMELNNVEALTPRSRAAVQDCMDLGMTVREMADELQLGSILSLSVSTSEAAFRVDAELIDANTLDEIWIQRFEGTQADAFGFKTKIAQRVLEELGVPVTAEESSAMEVRPTQNNEAYTLFLTGEEYRGRPQALEQDYLSAQGAYEQALDLDPDFALAHARIADVLRNLYTLRDLDEETASQVRHHAEEAFRLDPNLPEAHWAMGHAYYVDRDYVSALEEFEIALEGLPHDDELLLDIGFLYRRKGDFDRALTAFQRVAEINPRDPQNFHDLGGSTYWLLNRYADAIENFNRALQVAPGHDVAAVDKGWLYLLWRGQPDTLRAVLDRIPPGRELGHHLGQVELERARLLLWERKGDSLLTLMENTRDPVLRSQMELLPTSLFSAWAQRLLQDSASARGAFEASLVLLDSMLAEDAGDWRLHAARGLTLAGLGRTQEAVEEARWLAEHSIYRLDRFNGLSLREYRARVLAQAGEVNGAMDELEELVPGPSFYVSAWAVRLSPLFDPIRDHPRFQALLAEYPVEHAEDAEPIDGSGH
jgi:serine/threonine-protein kinase